MSKPEASPNPIQPADIKPKPTGPNIVYGSGADQNIIINESELEQTMQELGISDQGISDATIYIDPKNRFLNLGTHYPNRIGRARFHSNHDIQEAKGDIIRLSTKVRGKSRPTDSMNRILVHELEHLAQQDRHDKKLTEGHVAIYGLAAAGAIIGNHLGKGQVSQKLGAVLGAALGYQAGYQLAPHEKQSRMRARTVTTSAIHRKQ